MMLDCLGRLCFLYDDHHIEAESPSAMRHHIGSAARHYRSTTVLCGRRQESAPIDREREIMLSSVGCLLFRGKNRRNCRQQYLGITFIDDAAGKRLEPCWLDVGLVLGRAGRAGPCRAGLGCTDGLAIDLAV